MQTRLRLEEGWSTLLLLWLMIIVSGSAIMQADLIPGLQIIPLAGSLGLLAGLFLAKSRFPAKTAHLFSFIYGLFIVIYLVGTTLPDDVIWRERVFDIINRQVVWIQKAFEGGTSRDGLIFVVQTAVVFWLLGYESAWYTFRKPRVWRAVVPSGIVLLSVVYYYAGPKPLSLYLAVFVLLSLMYVARTHLVDQEKLWRASSVRYERRIWFTFLRAAFLTSLVALIVAWTLPTLSANAAVSDALGSTRDPWHKFQDNWTRLFASLRSYGTAVSDPYQDTLVLGGPRTVGTTLIMDVYVPKEMPYVYWQAFVYDTYENGRWQISRNTETNLHFPDDGFFDTPYTLSRDVITQTVVNYLPNSSTLYAAPEVVGANKQMFVDAAKDEQGSLLVSAVRSRYALRQGEKYEVMSRVSTADAESLRQATTTYPSWVTEQYLQLPNTITPETVTLANEITAGYTTNFDKAIAIRDYLRNNIVYNDQIEAAPDGMDSVHYTLFVLQEGYCNYYASAMTVMLRSQGIPARVVSGYAQGEYDDETRSYRVRASNAHTWVEVYFPEYGWIQFEPTAAIPTVDRPESSGGGDPFSSLGPTTPELDRAALLGEELAEDVDTPEGGFFADAAQEQSTLDSFLAEFPVWQAVTAIIVVLVAGALVIVGNEFNRRVEGDINRSYTRLGSWARWLGVLFRPVHTPYERADLMVSVVPEGRTSIRNLTQQFVLTQFSQARSPEEGFSSVEEWQRLRPILIKQGIINRLQRLQRKARRNNK